MNVNSVSFGKKIPVNRCKVFDKQKNEFVDVTCYEYDCKDESDYKEIRDKCGDWEFCGVFSYNMEVKNRVIKAGKKDVNSFYNIQKDDGDILGVCYLEEKNNNLEVKFIQSKRDNKHKYVGQVLLASIGSEVLASNKKKLVIQSALAGVYDFYEKTCGFKPAAHSDLEMNRFGIKKFIKRTERKTQTKFKNLRA